MKIRSLAVAAGTCIVLLTTGCGGAVAGEAEIAPGASVPAPSKSSPAPFPDPSSGGSTTSRSSTDGSSTDESSRATETSETDTSQSTPESTTETTDSTETTSSTRTTSSRDPEDTAVATTPVTSVPGLSKDCNAVLAGITAFSTLLQGAGAGDTISQAAVDEALKQLPESGLPARPQADITVLRTTVSGAAGKSLADFGQTLADGQVVDALKDLSSWAQENCG